MFKEITRVLDRLMVRLGHNWSQSDAPAPDGPKLEGYVKVTLKDKDGNVLQQTEGTNVITLYGREYFARNMCWAVWGGSPGASTPDADDGASGVPNHRVLYIGVGTGGVLEQASVEELGAAVPYAVGLYRKVVDTPTHPSIGVSRFQVEFLASEISFPPMGTQHINEFGLFLDNAGPSVASCTPIAYKVTEPLPKTQAFSMLVQWEVRFV